MKNRARSTNNLAVLAKEWDTRLRNEGLAPITWTAHQVSADSNEGRRAIDESRTASLADEVATALVLAHLRKVATLPIEWTTERLRPILGADKKVIKSTEHEVDPFDAFMLRHRSLHKGCDHTYDVMLDWFIDDLLVRQGDDIEDSRLRKALREPMLGMMAEWASNDHAQKRTVTKVYADDIYDDVVVNGKVVRRGTASRYYGGHEARPGRSEMTKVNEWAECKRGSDITRTKDGKTIVGRYVEDKDGAVVFMALTDIADMRKAKSADRKKKNHEAVTATRLTAKVTKVIDALHAYDSLDRRKRQGLTKTWRSLAIGERTTVCERMKCPASLAMATEPSALLMKPIHINDSRAIATASTKDHL